ncbi:hypothetical protein Tco_0684662 [Tanacetum coccineum]
MGLWYPKDSGFELTAFSDADHAGCLDTRKITSGEIQFLGSSTVSWIVKETNCTQCLSARGRVCVVICSWHKTEYQLADMFTKALPEDRFKYLVRRIGMRCLTPAELEKSKLSTLNDENVLLKTQVASVVKERENVKLEYHKLFNLIKVTRNQHKKEFDELTEHVNQNKYAYADVRALNQDLLITISELKSRLKTVDKGKHVNTKFDKSEALGTLLCVTPLPKNIAIKAKKLSNSKVNADRSKPVTSHPTPNNEQGVESSNSVRRQKSKDTKSKNRVLKNTNAKSLTAHVWKMSRSVSIDSNQCETMNSTLYHVNKSVINTKNVTAVNDESNIICVSYGKDVFLLSHEMCVAHYTLSRNSNIKRALFTTPIVAKSKNLRATSVVAKSRLSVTKTPKSTNKVFSAS